MQFPNIWLHLTAHILSPVLKHYLTCYCQEYDVNNRYLYLFQLHYCHGIVNKMRSLKSLNVIAVETETCHL